MSWTKSQKPKVSAIKSSLMSTVHQAFVTNLAARSSTSGRKQSFPSVILNLGLSGSVPSSGFAGVNHSNGRFLLPQTSRHVASCLPSIRDWWELTDQTCVYHQSEHDKQRQELTACLPMLRMALITIPPLLWHLWFATQHSPVCITKMDTKIKRVNPLKLSFLFF